MSLQKYEPLPVANFLRVIANPVILNTAPNENIATLPEFKAACHSIQTQVNLQKTHSRRLPAIMSAAIHFLRKAEHYDYFNLYGIPFITSFAGAVFGWNIRFLLAQKRFPDRRILIRGETGTGKEQVARLIGEIIAEFNTAKFITLNAANLSETLMEAELFGYERGAFTGAEKRRKGILADLDGGGVLFLDEITETPPAIQAKLLRLLETGEYRPVGSNAIHTARISIVAATNRQDLFQSDSIRNDLLYRLSESTIELPPLRQITEETDRAVLVFDHLILSAARDLCQNIDSVERQLFLSWVTEWSKSVARQLAQKWSGHQWPGNIRQCRNALRQVIMNYNESSSEESLEELPAPGKQTHQVSSRLSTLNTDQPVNLKQQLERCERAYYVWASKQARSIEAVAGYLGVTRQTASRRMKAFGLKPGIGIRD